MATHASAIKRARQTIKLRLHNRYYAKTARNAIKKLETETNKKAAQKKLPEVISMIDKLVKRNIIHRNKAAHLKSKLTKLANSATTKAIQPQAKAKKASPTKTKKTETTEAKKEELNGKS